MAFRCSFQHSRKPGHNGHSQTCALCAPRRRDPTNYRPRINKKESTKDREQKLAGTYYYLVRRRDDGRDVGRSVASWLE